MGKIYKIVNIAVVFMLLLEGGGFAYSFDISCLRVPFIDDKREEEALKIFKETRFRTLIALRSMRHSTVYDAVDTLTIACLFLNYVPPASRKLRKLYSKIKEQKENIRTILNEIPRDIFVAELEASKIIDWQSQLSDILDKLREIEREYDETKNQIPYTKLDESYRASVIDFASKVQKNIRKAIVILEDRIDFINNRVKKQNTDLNKIINDICLAFSGRSFSVNFQGGKLPNILTNPVMMEAAITNIFDNNINIKDINKMSVVTRLSSNGKEIIIEISDNGLGFPEEGLEVVPDKHYQKAFEFGWSYRPKDSVFDDMGIHGGFGLAETRVYLEEHGGSIRVDSEKGKGTTFTIILPLGSGETTDRTFIGYLKQEFSDYLNNQKPMNILDIGGDPPVGYALFGRRDGSVFSSRLKNLLDDNNIKSKIYCISHAVENSEHDNITLMCGLYQHLLDKPLEKGKYHIITINAPDFIYDLEGFLGALDYLLADDGVVIFRPDENRSGFKQTVNQLIETDYSNIFTTEYLRYGNMQDLPEGDWPLLAPLLIRRAATIQNLNNIIAPTAKPTDL